MGGHLPGHMRPAPCQIRMRLFSHPGWWVHRLAQGNLEAFVGGPIKGCLHEDGAIGQKPGKDTFLPLVCMATFAGELLVMHCRRPFWLHAVKWKLKPQQDPNRVYLHWTYWVVCQPATHIMHRRCPNKLHGHVPTQTPAVPAGWSNLARTC